MARIRTTIKDIGRGELTRPIKLRPGDYLTDLRDEVNQMLDALQRRGVPVLKPVDPANEDNNDQRTSA